MSDPEPAPAPEPTPTEPAPETTPTEPAPETTPTEPAPETTPTEPAPETTPTEPAPAELPLSLSSLGFPGSPPPPPVPEVPLDISDLLTDIAVVQQKEAGDASTLAGLSTIPMDALRQTLVPWAAQGFPNAHTIREVVIQPPPQCSDGVARSLADYIVFVSGKTLSEHIAVLQSRLSGIVVSYAWSGYSILIVVSKA